MIDTFVNAIFVYDDKIIGTFNYSGDKNTVTLAEINDAETLGKVFVHCAQCSTIMRTYEPQITVAVFKNVFALIFKITK